jgi:uncharacterized repeat protein (TIGR01451 family)
MLMVAVLLSAGNNIAEAGSRETTSNDFHHKHFITAPNCPVTITGITKTWSSSNPNLIKLVSNSGGTPLTSTQSSGSFYIPLSVPLGANATTFGALNFETHPGVVGSVTTNVTIDHTGGCGQPCQVQSQFTTHKELVNPVCTQSTFNKDEANPGEAVNFAWNITSPGGQVRLICGGAGFSLDENVPDTGNRNFTVPNGANDGASISCELKVGSTSLCSDNLPIEGIPDIRIIKTDNNTSDQDGNVGNDTQTINNLETAKFRILVENTGTEPLKNVVITDAEALGCARTSAQTQALYAGSIFQPGASFAYNCQETNVTETSFLDNDNDIRVDAQGNRSNTSVNDDDPSGVLLENVGLALIDIKKWADNPNDNDGVTGGGVNVNDNQRINSGTAAIFRIQVENTGEVELENVRVDDPSATVCNLNANQVREILNSGSSSKPGISGVQRLSGTNNNAILGPDEGFTYKCTTGSIVDGFTNTATTIGEPVTNIADVTSSDSTTVQIGGPTVTPGPKVRIVKTDENPADQDSSQGNDTQTIDEGQAAVFRITVYSLGTEPLKNVEITDFEAPNCNRSAAQTAPLYPGNKFENTESFTYTCSRSNVSEATFPDDKNDIRVDANGYNSNVSRTDEDDSHVVLIPTPPLCGNGYVDPGEDCDDGPLNGTAGSACTLTCEDVPTPTCVAGFDPSQVGPGDTSVFNWTTNNVVGGLQLQCDGTSGVSIDETVSANGSFNITVPNSASLGSNAQCKLLAGGTEICQDTLHVNPICGNGSLEGLEQCDDGNLDDGDGCSSSCQLEPTCVGTPSFAPGRVFPGTSSLFTWSTANTGVDVTLNCTGSAGFNLTETVFASDSRLIPVPTNAADESEVICQIKEGNQSITSCNATLIADRDLNPPHVLRVVKWAANDDDKDGINSGNNATNDTQTVESISDNGLDKAVFRIRAENIGTEPLVDLVMADANAPVCALNETEVRTILSTGTLSKTGVTNVQVLNEITRNNQLDPGEAIQYDCQLNNIRDGLTNTAIGTANGLGGTPVVTSQDATHVLVDNCEGPDCVPVNAPNITIIKTDKNPIDFDTNIGNDTQTISPGATAVFEITVTNNGNKPLKRVQVLDSESPNCALSEAQTKAKYPGEFFDIGETFTYECEKTNAQLGDFDGNNGEGSINGKNDARAIAYTLDNISVAAEDPSAVVFLEGPAFQIDVLKWSVNRDDKDGVSTGNNDVNDTQTVESIAANNLNKAEFRIRVENAGANSLTEVRVRDDLSPACALSVAEVATILTSGTLTRTGISNVSVVNEITADNIFQPTEVFVYDCLQPEVVDSYTNTASALGLNADGDDVVGSDTSEVVVDNGPECEPNCPPEDPSILIDKTAANPNDQDGDLTDDSQLIETEGTAIFRITVTNNGKEALKSVIISDDEAPDCALTAGESITKFPGVLFDPGETFNYTCERADVMPGDFDTTNAQGSVDEHNDARVDAESNEDDTPVFDEDPTRIELIPLYVIDVLKWARNDNDKDGVTSGNNAANDTQTVESVPDNNLDKAVFRIRVENTGIRALKDVRVQDANSAACRLTPDQVREILNEGRSSKTTITGVAIQNEVIANDLLEPGEAFVYNCTQSNIVDGFTNVAKAIGTAVDDSADVDAIDSSEVIVRNDSCEPDCPVLPPAIEIVKTDANTADFDGVQGNDNQILAVDTTAVFRITVTNTGGEPLKNVIISDDESLQCAKDANGTKDLYPGEFFEPGETFTYTCEKPNANPGDFDGGNAQGSVDEQNDARVDARSTVDDDPVDDEDASRVEFITQCTAAQGQITIIKDDSTPGQPDTDGDDIQKINSGGTAIFTISVANPGTTVITDISVSDTLSPNCARSQAEFMALLGAVGDNDNELDPGEAVTYTCEQTNVTANYTNSATVSGSVAAIPCVVTATDTSEVEIAVVIDQCGNGIVNTGEQCDDGNNIDGDGCSASCTLEGAGFCGDGVIQAPEECDNGPNNGQNGNSCSAGCVLNTCVGGSCDGGTPPTSAVGTCAFSEFTGAALCTRKRPVEDVSNPLWVAYRECREQAPGAPVPRNNADTIEKACALDWAQDQGLALCGANVGGAYIDPFADPTNAEILAQCDFLPPVLPPTETCTPIGPVCAGCFKSTSDITKRVKSSAGPESPSASATVAIGANAKYEITVDLSGFNDGWTPGDVRYVILDAQIQVHDQTIATESGNIFGRSGIEDGDGDETWKWCKDEGGCPDPTGNVAAKYGEYFYLNMNTARIDGPSNKTYVEQINDTGATTLKVHYDMNTAVASTKDTAKIANIAYGMVYYTYAAIDTTTGLELYRDDKIVGIGNDVCPSVPTVVSDLAKDFFGEKATVNIIRPFIKAKAGNAGYFTDGANPNKAFGDQNNILTPTENLNYGLTLTDDTTLYGETDDLRGDDDEFAKFQDQKEAFYTNISAATDPAQTVPGTSVQFKKVGSANLFEIDGDLDIAVLADIDESATFILKDGNLIVNSDFIFTNRDVFGAFIVREGDVLIDASVKDMEGMYLVEQGKFQSWPAGTNPDPKYWGTVSTEQLTVQGSLYGDLRNLLTYRRYIGDSVNIEPSIEINFDLRLLEYTPPMLEQFLGEGWRDAVQE